MKTTKVSMILIGNWNPRIFTPAWIKTNLFGISEKDDIQGLVNFEDMHFAFKYDGIMIMPKYDSFEISIDSYDKDNGAKAAEIIIKILELLPQTPIKAMGINIKYTISKITKLGLISVLNTITGDFGDFKLNQVRQSLTKEKYILNIVSDFVNENYIVNFNFHYPNINAFDLQFINEHYKETQTILTNGK